MSPLPGTKAPPGLWLRRTSVRPDGAFTLLEVIVALGLLAGGLVAVLAMFGTLSRLAVENDEERGAVRAAATVHGELRRWQFSAVLAALSAGDAGEPLLFLVSRSGELVALADDPGWVRSEVRPFFAVTLGRAGLPVIPAPAGEPAWIAFVLGVSWPVTEAGPARRGVTLFPGSVRR